MEGTESTPSPCDDEDTESVHSETKGNDEATDSFSNSTDGSSSEAETSSVESLNLMPSPVHELAVPLPPDQGSDSISLDEHQSYSKFNIQDTNLQHFKLGQEDEGIMDMRDDEIFDSAESSGHDSEVDGSVSESTDEAVPYESNVKTNIYSNTKPQLLMPTSTTLSKKVEVEDVNSKNNATKPILVFNEYGNLTVLDDIKPDQPFDYTMMSPLDVALSEVTSSFQDIPDPENVDLKFKDVSNSAPLIKNCSIKKTNKAINKVNSDDGNEQTVFSDHELKQAFKSELNTIATSRYGRPRKKKTEDGFLFGTINFNELRRITGNSSPKKTKLPNLKSSSKSDDKNAADYKSEESDIENVNTLSDPPPIEEQSDVMEEKDTPVKSEDKPNEIKEEEDDGDEDFVDEEVKFASPTKKHLKKKSTSKKVLKVKKVKKIKSKKNKMKDKIKVKITRSKRTSKEDEPYVGSSVSSIISTPVRQTRAATNKDNIDREARMERRVKLRSFDLDGNSDSESDAKYKVADNDDDDDDEEQEHQRHDVKEEVIVKSPGFKDSDEKPDSDYATCDEKDDIKADLLAILNGIKESNRQSGKEKNKNKETVNSPPSEQEETSLIKQRTNRSLRLKATETSPPLQPSKTTKFGRQSKKPDLMDISMLEQKQKEQRDKIRSPNQHNQFNGPTPQEMKALEDQCTCDFLIGDIVWVRMRRNPIWPAIMSYSREGVYTKALYSQSLYKSRFNRIYHVKFFNDNNQTLWVNSTSVMPYNGFDQLAVYLEENKEKEQKISKNRGDIVISTQAYMSKIKSGKGGTKHDKWMTAVKDADDTMVLQRHDRIQKYTSDSDWSESAKSLDPDWTDTRKPHLKKRGRPKKTTMTPLPPMKRKVNGDSTDGEFSGFDDNVATNVKSKKIRKVVKCLTKGYFSVYFKERKEVLLAEQPSLNDDAIRKKLRCRWRKMNDVQKARYKANSYDDSMKRKHGCSDSDESIEEEYSTSTSKRKKLLDSESERSSRANSEECVKGTYRVVRNEKVCYQCESVSNDHGLDMVKCKGSCSGVFHYKCLGLSTMPEKDFKCDECLANKHTCFVCKSNEGETQKCSVYACGKYYHENCVREWPQTSKPRLEKLVCPRHICHMCSANADDMCDPVARTAPFTRCLRCPTAYHTGEDCLSAGCEEITQHHHICTKHLKHQKHHFPHHVNVNWCFCCSKGGSLLLCDQCPAAFHADCMNITASEEGYVCEDCENGKFPIYGDVVWVKLGNYRWWPAQVLHPRFIPDNIENLSHKQGMFCVHFLGTNDYYWVTRGRTFQYQEGDQGAKSVCSSKVLEKRFVKALEEAADAYRVQMVRRDKSEAVRNGKGNIKPPPYVKIESNKPVGSVKFGKLDLTSVNRCDCDPNVENPCGDDDKCINRMLMFECIKEACVAGERCSNQRFQKRQYPLVHPSKTEGRGWGLRTKEDIKKGEFVIEYVGELVDDEEFRKRIDEMHAVKEENYYFLTIDKSLIIDAGPKGNLARFMNHSCEPNCETQKWTVGSDTRVGLFAMQDITAGSEVTFNYNLECVGTEKKRCHCGAVNCSGFIGAKVQIKKPALKKEKFQNGNKKKKKHKKKASEDDCFRCGAPGDLILCDVTSCPKGYHLTCLGLSKLPKGKWLCPWHHCDECGNRATSLCGYCPNSFCRHHAVGKMQTVQGVGNVCYDHNPEEVETLRGQMEMTAVNLMNPEKGNIVESLNQMDQSEVLTAVTAENLNQDDDVSAQSALNGLEVLKAITSIDYDGSSCNNNYNQITTNNNYNLRNNNTTDGILKQILNSPVEIKHKERQIERLRSKGLENNSSVLNVISTVELEKSTVCKNNSINIPDSRSLDIKCSPKLGDRSDKVQTNVTKEFIRN